MSKLAILQRDLDELKKDLSDIVSFEQLITNVDTQASSASTNTQDPSSLQQISTNAMSNRFTQFDPIRFWEPQNPISITQSQIEPNSAIVQFIRRYPELVELADRLVTKPFKLSIDVPADDFERETVSRLQLVQESENLQQAIRVKDAMIWLLLQERQQLQDSVQEAVHHMSDLDRECRRELDHWTKLTDSLAMRLNQLDMVCSKCSIRLSPSSINGDCIIESHQAIQDSNNLRHHFVSISYQANQSTNFSSANTHSPSRRTHSRLTTPSPLHRTPFSSN